ncbi:DUF2231 domain-containing protein [Compostibacter hankyongensis]|uniref:Rieske domain-containing protein n=1 Tax=Compostibacter hankyongensis TaxID=1007089 RepID=A0ABP8FYY1_9BACT
MKSRANIKGHPLHPILVGFPIAFFTGTLVFDVLGWIADPSLYDTALYLEIAGLFCGLLAAVPGMIDLTQTVPPRSSAKKRGISHGLLNGTALVFFAAALFYRLQSEGIVIAVLLGLEIIGMIFLFCAAWMGGTLVYRNQIGIDPRYAEAGKWKELYPVVSNGQLEIPGAGALKVNQMRLVHAGGKRIVIARTEQGFAAFDDHCSHKGGSLAGGAMICGTVQCPWHGSQFDVNTGEVRAGPAQEKIGTYATALRNGKLYLSGL